MEEIILFLEKTKPEHFLSWLVDTTRRLGNKYRYPGQVGQYSVQIARETGPGSAEVLATNTVGVWIDEDNELPAKEGALIESDFPLMIFHWLSVGEGLQLRIEHITEPPLVDHVYRFMTELGRAWPGTMKIITDHFKWEIECKESEEDILSKAQKDEHELMPWKKIPDHGYDRYIIELWCKGHTNSEIARKVFIQPESVTNIISKLRINHPKAGIPTAEQRRKRMIRDDIG